MSGWPWPLSYAQAWFDDLWSWVEEAANAAVSVVSTWISDGLSWLSGFVQGVGSWLWSSIQGAFSTAQNFISGVGSALSGAFSAAVSTITSTFSSVGSWLHETLGGLISGVGSAITNAASGLASFITNGLTAIGQALTSLGSSVVGAISGAINGAVTWAQNGLSWIGEQLVSLGSNVINAIGGALETVGSAIVSGIGGVIGPITEGLGGVFNLLGNLGKGFDPSALVTDAMAAIQSVLETFSRALSSKSPRSPEEAYNITWDTINQVSAAYMTQTIALIIAEAVSVGQLDISPQGLAHTPQMESALTTVQTLFATMADISLVRPLQHFFNRAFTPEIPGSGDLIRFVVREVMEPGRFYDLMALQGFSQEFSLAYWEAHWQLPAPSVLIEALHRGVISKEEFDKYMIWHDFKPENRPGISKSDLSIYAGTLKRLIPRVDIRYAWEMGLVNDEDLVAWYEYLGYEEDAGLMADIQKVRAMVEEINKVRNEDLADFVAGYIDESTLRANLGALGISGTRVEYYVAYGHKRRVRNQKKELLDIYQDGYVNDMVTDEQLQAYAEELITEPDARELYIQRAYVRKYKAPAPPTAEKVKVASTSTLTSLYRADAITEEQLRTELESRNYARSQIDLMVEAENIKKSTAAAEAAAAAAAAEAAKIKYASLSTLASLYRQDALDEGDFRLELTRRNYAPDQIELMIEAENLKKAAAAEELA